MKREFPFYTRYMFGNDYPTITLLEVNEDGWTEIQRVTAVDDPSYVYYSISKKSENMEENEHWDTSWLHSPDYQGTKYEFDLLKTEFLNWLDQTFER